MRSHPVLYLDLNKAAVPIQKLPRSTVRDGEKTATAPREKERIYELNFEQLSPRSVEMTESLIDTEEQNHILVD